MIECCHTLKVQKVGDFYRRKTHPQIRLEGKWIERAGIPAEAHVVVTSPRPGVLLLEVKP